jgi:hypothetical protein
MARAVALSSGSMRRNCPITCSKLAICTTVILSFRIRIELCRPLSQVACRACSDWPALVLATADVI